MKNMKKLLQKAMVFTLTAAMLVGTPLTASAAGLVDLYQIEDGWGNVTGNEDNTRTGTVTATQTNSGILDANAQLEGIVLDETNFELEIPEEKPTRLTASLEWGTVDGTVPEAYKALNDDLLKRLQWKSSNTAIVALDTKSVEGKFKDGPRDVITLKPKAAGTATVTVSLDSAQHNIHYSATATITVVQYADRLAFDNLKIADDAFTGNTLALDEYVDRYVNGVKTTTSDVLTYVLKDDGNKAATLKNGVLTLKKKTDENKPVQVVAIGKNTRTRGNDIGKINIKVGANATAVTFSADGISKMDGKKLKWRVNDGMETTVTAKVTKVKVDKQTKDANDTDFCTDRITWSSKKPGIVEVTDTTPQRSNDKKDSEKGKKNEYSMKLKAVSAGSTQIVAKASSGKSFSLSVTVSADLTDIVIEKKIDDPKNGYDYSTLYSGQTIDLNELTTQMFDDNGKPDFIDAGLKWTFESADAKKAAKINAKTGVLEILPDLSKYDLSKPLKIKAVNGKKIGGTGAGQLNCKRGKNVVEFNLAQVNITKITIARGTVWNPIETKLDTNKVPYKIVQNPVANKSKDTINVGDVRTYTLTAEGYVANADGTKKSELDEAELRKALGWTASGNGKTIKATRGKNGVGVLRGIKKGSATITASGATFNGKNKFVPIKATFKDTVNAPTKTIKFSVKNKDIALKYKGTITAKQTVAIRPILDKGSTTKNKAKNGDIEWTAKLVRGESEVKGAVSIDQAGKLTLEEGKYAAGDQIKINAKVKNGGPQTSMTMTVVWPTKKVKFKNSTGSEITKELSVGADGDRVTTWLESSIADKTGNAGEEQRADIVSITVSGKGSALVSRAKNSDGTVSKSALSIEPIAAGKVSVKIVTSDGKTGTLKLNITAVGE